MTSLIQPLAQSRACWVWVLICCSTVPAGGESRSAQAEATARTPSSAERSDMIPPPHVPRDRGLQGASAAVMPPGNLLHHHEISRCAGPAAAQMLTQRTAHPCPGFSVRISACPRGWFCYVTLVSRSGSVRSALQQESPVLPREPPGEQQRREARRSGQFATAQQRTQPARQQSKSPMHTHVLASQAPAHASS